jgi:uncharacterized phiE125 gp8 family phage protein
MALKLVTPATAYPVSLQEMKDHLRVDGTDEDDLVTSLIAAGTGYAEAEARRAFVTQTWRLSLDAFPSPARGCRSLESGQHGLHDPILIPLAPVIAVSSLTYVDTAGDTQTWSSSNYTVDADAEPARVVPAYGVAWPATRDVPNAVKVTFTAGYGAASAVPDGVKVAIRMLAAHWYENREAVAVEQGVTTAPVPMAVDALLGRYRWGSYQ